MNEYDWKNVTDADFQAAPRPTTQDTVILAQAMAMLSEVGVPLLEWISNIAEISPNAKIRWVLKQIYGQMRDETTSISEAFSVHPDIFDEDFLEACVRGEITESFSPELLHFARSKDPTPNQLLSQAIGYVREIAPFSKSMYEQIRNKISVEQALSSYISLLQRKHWFKQLLHRMLARYDETGHLWEALEAEYSTFGRIYCNIIKASEVTQQLIRGFELLSLP